MESQAFVQSIFDLSSSEFGIINIDEKELEFTSGTFEEKFGYSRKELAAFSKNKFFDITHPEDISKAEKKFQELEKSDPGEIVETLLRMRKSTGEYVWVLGRHTVFVRKEDGSPKKLASVLDDVNKLVEMESKLGELESQIVNKRCHTREDIVLLLSHMIGITSLIDRTDFKSDFHANVFGYLSDMIKRANKSIAESEVP